MKYLFFDIECANCFDGVGKICEFGYVMTDENFNVIQNGIFLINPDAEFDWYVKHKIISYKISDYLKASKYPDVYRSHIKKLFEQPDTIYIGHGIKNDVKYLNDEAKRYGLLKMDFNYVDASIIRKKFYNEPQIKSLKRIVKELEIGNPQSLHNSEYDAQITVEYVKLMCKESGLNFAQLIEKYTKNKNKVVQMV